MLLSRTPRRSIRRAISGAIVTTQAVYLTRAEATAILKISEETILSFAKRCILPARKSVH